MSNKTDKKAKHGKQNNPKMKPYLIMQYLLKNSDENNVITAYEIVDYLEECGITAERRSVYRDIKEINKAALMLEEDYTIEEAEQELADKYKYIWETLARKSGILLLVITFREWLVWALHLLPD